jgi:diadenosine tetraphosphate (Ap4A) HIT family hydrolase
VAPRQDLIRNVNTCIFCEPPRDGLTLRNDFAYVLRDAFPVTPSHSFVIPYRHVPDYFSLTQDELLACDQLLRKTSDALRAADPAIAGFNIGVNVGSAAGQTVPHCHLHLIPRREGDVENPRGGIRHVIPGKGDY